VCDSGDRRGGVPHDFLGVTLDHENRSHQFGLALQGSIVPSEDRPSRWFHVGGIRAKAIQFQSYKEKGGSICSKSRLLQVRSFSTTWYSRVMFVSVLYLAIAIIQQPFTRFFELWLQYC